MTSRTNFNGWQILKTLGKGGQGEVHLARKAPDLAPVPLDRVMEAIRNCAAYTHEAGRRTAAEEFVSLVRSIAADVLSQDRARTGALKVLHEIEDKAASEKATARMARELEALGKLKNSSLVQVGARHKSGTGPATRFFADCKALKQWTP